MTTGEARELPVNRAPFEKIFGKLIYLLRGLLDREASTGAGDVVPWARFQR
jgi:hypothetical protein